MTPTKPYLIRAFYEWINDNKCTPYVVIDATQPKVYVPEPFVEDGKIVLNVSGLAVRGLHIDNKAIQFSARFRGVPTEIYAPISAVPAIYAHENGRGMVFSEEDNVAVEEEEGTGRGDHEPPSTNPPKGKPKLTVVK